MDIDKNLGDSVVGNVDVDQMSAARLDVCLVRQADIPFFKNIAPLFLDRRENLMFRESSKDLRADSLERKIKLLSVEIFLHVECLFEAHTRLILTFFAVGFTLFEQIRSEFSHDSLRDEGVARL